MTREEVLKWTDSSYRPASPTTIRYRVIYVLKPSSYEAKINKNTEPPRKL
ncbi:hypothetical protein Hanom_Chr03g00221001 [Helianthus anomalus]